MIIELKIEGPANISEESLLILDKALRTRPIKKLELSLPDYQHIESALGIFSENLQSISFNRQGRKPVLLSDQLLQHLLKSSIEELYIGEVAVNLTVIANALPNSQLKKLTLINGSKNEQAAKAFGEACSISNLDELVLTGNTAVIKAFASTLKNSSLSNLRIARRDSPRDDPPYTYLLGIIDNNPLLVEITYSAGVLRRSRKSNGLIPFLAKIRESTIRHVRLWGNDDESDFNQIRNLRYEGIRVDCGYSNHDLGFSWYSLQREFSELGWAETFELDFLTKKLARIAALVPRVKDTRNPLPEKNYVRCNYEELTKLANFYASDGLNPPMLDIKRVRTLMPAIVNTTEYPLLCMQDAIRQGNIEALILMYTQASKAHRTIIKNHLPDITFFLNTQANFYQSSPHDQKRYVQLYYAFTGLVEFYTEDICSPDIDVAWLVQEIPDFADVVGIHFFHQISGLQALHQDGNIITAFLLLVDLPEEFQQDIENSMNLLRPLLQFEEGYRALLTQQKQDFLRLMGYYAQNNPEILKYIDYGIEHPDEVTPPLESNTSHNKSTITFEELKKLVQQALKMLDPKSSEALLLGKVLQEQSYNPIAVDYLSHSLAMKTVFNEHYPDEGVLTINEQELIKHELYFVPKEITNDITDAYQIAKENRNFSFSEELQLLKEKVKGEFPVTPV